MSTKDDPAETARLCRIQAALTTSPETRACLLKLAEHYDTKPEDKSEGRTLDCEPREIRGRYRAG